MIQYRHQYEMERLAGLSTKATMTDHAPTTPRHRILMTDSSTQVDIRCCNTTSSISCSSSASVATDVCCHDNSHAHNRKRRHSDSDIGLTEPVHRVRSLSATDNRASQSRARHTKCQAGNGPTNNDEHVRVRGTTSRGSRGRACQCCVSRVYGQRCVWQVQLRNCQTRLKTLTKQVGTSDR